MRATRAVPLALHGAFHFHTRLTLWDDARAAVFARVPMFAYVALCASQSAMPDNPGYAPQFPFV
ncbi:hypothetical protein A6456_08955 [Paraburkholderia tropica]|nr:hypothetical protein A6456_08955 [Paraburkholderia tropica]